MLDLGFTTQNLYTALRLKVSFETTDGTVKTGYGTGFVVRWSSSPDRLYLVTARHLVDPARAIPRFLGASYLETEVTGLNYATDATQQTPVHFTLRGPVIVPENSEIDIAILPVENVVGWNRIPLLGFVPRSLLAEAEEFELDIRTGDFIAAPGYAPLPDVETDRPVLMTGIVSSDPRVPVRVSPSGFSARAVLYQSLSRSGLSGAPVFATQRGIVFGEGLSGPPHRPMRLIGVNAGSFIDPQTMPLQFSYFTRSSEILNLLGE